MDQKIKLSVDTDSNKDAKSFTNPFFSKKKKKTDIFADARWKRTLTEPFVDPFLENFAYREVAKVWICFLVIESICSFRSIPIPDLEY